MRGFYTLLSRDTACGKQPDKMADDSSEKTAEITIDKQETTDNSKEEKDESKKEDDDNVSDPSNDLEKRDLDAENTAQNECISEESPNPSAVENNVPIKTGFLRSFIEKKKILQGADGLEVSEDSNG